MNRFTLSQMVKFPKLSDLLLPSYQEFYPERLVTDVGLYEALLIDAADVQVFTQEIGDVQPHIEVSRDVEALHKFLNLKERIMLPCPECRQNQPFELKAYFNPQKVQVDLGKPSFTKGSNQIRVPITQVENIYGAVDDRTSGVHNVFDPPKVPKYRIGSDYLRDFDQTQFEGVDFADYMKQCALSCVDGIAEQVAEIRRDFFCTLEILHRGFVDFIIYEAVDRYTLPPILQQYEKRKECDSNAVMTKEEKKAAEVYEHLKTCLIMEKVGQSPSMADLQMFDVEKYRSVLTKEHFRDFKTALGLHASGVGCGSFVYLRRIFEGLVAEAEQTASTQSGWDAEEYVKKRFNEKIDYLEAFGQKLIPDVLNPVKTKIYGILSRGVHASSDQECNELFPVMKFVIEELLDQQIAIKEREERLKQLTSKLGSIQ